MLFSSHPILTPRSFALPLSVRPLITMGAFLSNFMPTGFSVNVMYLTPSSERKPNTKPPVGPAGSGNVSSSFKIIAIASSYFSHPSKLAPPMLFSSHPILTPRSFALPLSVRPLITMGAFLSNFMPTGFSVKVMSLSPSSERKRHTRPAGSSLTGSSVGGSSLSGSDIIGASLSSVSRTRATSSCLSTTGSWAGSSLTDSTCVAMGSLSVQQLAPMFSSGT